MIFWPVLALMTLAACLLVAWPLLRPRQRAGRWTASDLPIYKDQLESIERDARLGLLNAEDAAATRLEIQRRLLRARQPVDESPTSRTSIRAPVWLSLVAVLVIGPGLVYGLRGRPEFAKTGAGETPQAVADPADGAAENTNATLGAALETLRKRVEDNPEDAEAWRFLGWVLFRAERFDESADAYAKTLALQPGSAPVMAAQAEAMTLAAHGQVTEAALAVFEAALAIDAKEPRARYYLALSRRQQGDVEGALTQWIALLADAPPDAAWAPGLRASLIEIAKTAGQDLRDRLPKGSVVTPTAPDKPALGPTAGAVAAAAALSPQARQAMIEGMVSRLAAKLRDNPEDPEGWIRLMRSQRVLGQHEAARESLAKALHVFADRPGIRRQISEAAAAADP